MKKAVILLNMGGPNNESEISLFLKNMFNDPYILGIKWGFLRKILARIITHFRTPMARENYESLGLKSPINAYTQKLVAKLNKNSEIHYDYAMNYTPPFADEVLAKYQNFDEVILFPLYPHYSKTTILSSLETATLSADKLGIKSLKKVDFFYQNREYNEIILNLIKDKISAFSTDEISQTTLIFSAHSLPKKHIQKGDIYEAHINNHVEILREILRENGIKFADIILAYQSRLGPVEWLGPNLGDVLGGLGTARALIFPISFCVDNSETEFELDIFYREFAKNFEYYEVCKAPNFRDDFVKFIKNCSLNTKEI